MKPIPTISAELAAMAAAGTVVLVIAALGSFVPAIGLAGGLALSIALLTRLHVEFRFFPSLRRAVLAGWWTLAVAVLALRVATSIPLAAPDVAPRGETRRPHPDVTTRVRTVPTVSKADMPLVGAIMEVAPVTCSVAVWVRADGTVRSAEADVCPRLYADAAARVGARFVFEPVPALRSDEVAATRVGVAFGRWGSTNADAVDEVPRSTLFWMSEETRAPLQRYQGERVAYVHPDILDTADPNAAFELQMGLDGWHYGSVDPLEVRELLDGEDPGAVGPRTALEAHTRLHDTAPPRWVEQNLYPYRLDRESVTARLLYEALQVEQLVRERDDWDGDHRAWCLEWLADTKGACSARALARWWSVPGQGDRIVRPERPKVVTAASYLAFVDLSPWRLNGYAAIWLMFVVAPAIAFGVWTRWRTTAYRRWLSEHRHTLTVPHVRPTPFAFDPALEITLPSVVGFAPTPPSSVRQDQERLANAARTYDRDATMLRVSCRLAWNELFRALDDLPEVRAAMGIDTADEGALPWWGSAQAPNEWLHAHRWLERLESSLRCVLERDAASDGALETGAPASHVALDRLAAFRAHLDKLKTCTEGLRTALNYLTDSCIDHGLLTPAEDAA